MTLLLIGPFTWNCFADTQQKEPGGLLYSLFSAGITPHHLQKIICLSSMENEEYEKIKELQYYLPELNIIRSEKSDYKSANRFYKTRSHHDYDFSDNHSQISIDINQLPDSIDMVTILFDTGYELTLPDIIVIRNKYPHAFIHIDIGRLFLVNGYENEFIVKALEVLGHHSDSIQFFKPDLMKFLFKSGQREKELIKTLLWDYSVKFLTIVKPEKGLVGYEKEPDGIRSHVLNLNENQIENTIGINHLVNGSLPSEIIQTNGYLKALKTTLKIAEISCSKSEFHEKIEHIRINSPFII